MGQELDIRKPDGCEAIAQIDAIRTKYSRFTHLSCGETSTVETSCPIKICPLYTKSSTRYIDVIRGHSIMKRATSSANSVIRKRCPLNKKG